jgi:Shwachman-Bodian-Diamond syndrome (SBDS) protein
MPRGNVSVTKVFFKGNTEDFIVFVESIEDLAKWKQDSSIPLAQVVDSFKIMITHK